MDVRGRRIRQIFLYTESVNNKPKTFCSTEGGLWENMMQQLMCIAIDEMVNEGEKRGADKVNRLHALLLENNRLEDLRRAVGDTAFQKQLFREFEL